MGNELLSGKDFKKLLDKNFGEPIDRDPGLAYGVMLQHSPTANNYATLLFDTGKPIQRLQFVPFQLHGSPQGGYVVNRLILSLKLTASSLWVKRIATDYSKFLIAKTSG